MYQVGLADPVLAYDHRARQELDVHVGQIAEVTDGQSVNTHRISPVADIRVRGLNRLPIQQQCTHAFTTGMHLCLQNSYLLPVGTLGTTQQGDFD
jgi:hypothetical protein